MHIGNVLQRVQKQISWIRQMAVKGRADLTVCQLHKSIHY
jgi:hypothetical protein